MEDAKRESEKKITIENQGDLNELKEEVKDEEARLAIVKNKKHVPSIAELSKEAVRVKR